MTRPRIVRIFKLGYSNWYTNYVTNIPIGTQLFFFATVKYRWAVARSLCCFAKPCIKLLEYLLQDPDAKKLRMEARRAAKEARLVERRKEKEENQKCKAIERYEDSQSRELVLKWSYRRFNISRWKYSPFSY